MICFAMANAEQLMNAFALASANLQAPMTIGGVRALGLALTELATYARSHVRYTTEQRVCLHCSRLCTACMNQQ